MSKRLNTIIIVPHSKARFVKLSFSTRSMVLAGTGVAISVMLSIIAMVYTGSAVTRRAQVERLKDENGQLMRVNKELERTIDDVQARLDEFEERTSRLALAAGMDTDRLVPSGVGSSTDRVGSGGPYDRLPESPQRLDLQGDLIDQRLAMVEEQLLDQRNLLASTPTVAPVLGILTDGFGSRKDPITGRRAFHRGLDISARRGTTVVAPADGVVVFAGRDGGLGRVVRISHGFGFTTVFGHLQKTLVEPGDEIARQQPIGLLGSTGRSTGPHLHYEVHVDGRAVDPLYYILDAY
jgi:murein DD-endopeptidase MepM/ murein hydrolase activator NlpD